LLLSTHYVKVSDCVWLLIESQLNSSHKLIVLITREMLKAVAADRRRRRCWTICWRLR